MHSAIYQGWVRHRRFVPRGHEFRYRSTLFYLDLDELPRLFDGLWLWGFNRRRLGWFRRADYLHPEQPDLKQAVREEVVRQTGECPSGPVRLLTNLRQDLQWSASWSDDGQQIRLTRGSQDAPEAKTVQAERRQVIDAGFDPFIQSQWETLMNGERVTFHFAFPNRLTNVRLRAERIDASDSPIQKQQERWAYFQIRVNSAVLSLFADNLYLAYDPDEKRLMVFRGRSNIPDAEGDGWDVEIHYRYP